MRTILICAIGITAALATVGLISAVQSTGSTSNTGSHTNTGSPKVVQLAQVTVTAKRAQATNQLETIHVKKMPVVTVVAPAYATRNASAITQQATQTVATDDNV